MKKRFFIIALASVMSLCLASCGEKEEHKSQITGEGTASESSAKSSSASKDPNATIDPAAAEAVDAAKKSADEAVIDSSYIAETIAPAATPDPESAAKAQEKIDAAGGETNVVINDGSSERTVNLKFSLENHTGIDFPAMLLAPVDVELSAAPEVLGGQMFTDGLSLDLNPSIPDGTQLTTALFNIVPVDANGRGYVFQNIDLSTSSVIQLYLDDGVPKAVIN